MLIVFGGRSGSGKTTIARELARQTGAVFLRIDSIEQAIRSSAIAPRSVEDAGYRAAYAAAADNLRLGRMVVADSVNPIGVTRDAWREVALGAGVDAIEVEVICSDQAEHRRRVERRTTDVTGLRLPTWAEVTAREYEPWARERVVIDTAHAGVDESVAALRAAIASRVR
jgi:predicted kinase